MAFVLNILTITRTHTRFIVRNPEYVSSVGQISRLGTLEIFMNHWGRDEQEAMAVLENIVNFRPDCQDFSLVQ